MGGLDNLIETMFHWWCLALRMLGKGLLRFLGFTEKPVKEEVGVHEKPI